MPLEMQTRLSIIMLSLSGIFKVQHVASCF